jgi:hypothetical protein
MENQGDRKYNFIKIKQFPNLRDKNLNGLKLGR